MKKIYFILLLVSTAIPSWSQQVVQSLTGRVTDHWSLQAVTAANVSLYAESNLVKGASTDSSGVFFIKDIEPGRYKIIVSHTGYSSYESELLIISGKSQQLNIELEESQRMLDEVVIVPPAISSANTTTISIEKAMRVPANFFDPVRMLTSYPGVVAANDQSNAIVVKGYSPNALMWRLQGLDIINPNHLANAGTFSDKPTANGGGVNVLSAQLLDRTDFRSGALPVQYGNALSGVMDMNLRAGNANKMQYTAQASLVGMDIAAEGPIDREKRSSFLANYRYSTVGLLTQMGLDFGGERISFQDFSFHLNMPSAKGSNLSVFGFGGLSENRFDRKAEEEWETEKDRYDIDFTGAVYGVGFVNSFKPGWATVSAGISFSGQEQTRKSQGAIVPYPNTFRESFTSNQQLASGFIKGVRKFSSSGVFEAGVRLNYHHHQMNVTSINQQYLNFGLPNFEGTVDGLLWQPYMLLDKQWGNYRVGAGFRFVYFSYNQSSSSEPRIYISRSSGKNLITLSYGITSQIQQAQNYLSIQNSDLGLTKANQIALEWRRQMKDDLNIVSSIYYHQLFDAPVYINDSHHSVINQWDNFLEEEMVNSGKGRNYGIEGSIEKKFIGSIYFLTTASFYQSEFEVDGQYVDTRFNGNFTGSITSGKEWKKAGKAFGVHARVIYAGGLRQPLINVNDSKNIGTTIFNVYNGFGSQLPNYFRSDLRISWRKNKPAYTRTLSIDIQNLTSYKNVGNAYFDTYLQQVKFRYQVGIIPVIAYRIDF